MSYTIYVDGQEGTTGLQIHERLKNIKDIEVIKIDEDKRKDPLERSKLMDAADLVFLCLPDAAAIEAVSLIRNDKTKVIDTSTAHRTSDSWAYGLPELSSAHREAIKNSRRVANPGCHATALILPVYPLVKKNIIPADCPLSAFSITGYSGGGKNLIKKYESRYDGCTNLDPMSTEVRSGLDSPNLYSLSLNHKHLPEIQKVCGLSVPPLFVPIVANYYQGITAGVQLHRNMMNTKLNAIEVRDLLASYYENEKFIKVIPYESDSWLDEGYLNATNCNNSNNAEIFVFGSDDHILLVTRLDNLGKGASGAAVQNMNLMLNLDEATGLS
jgi:N-acetyl-gamma-glutamyl-phosphate reductase